MVTGTRCHHQQISKAGETSLDVACVFTDFFSFTWISLGGWVGVMYVLPAITFIYLALKMALDADRA